MGVVLHILTKKRIQVRIESRVYAAGVAVPFKKLTEMSDADALHVFDMEEAAPKGEDSPKIVMVAAAHQHHLIAPGSDFPAPTDPQIECFPVIGWDDGRATVADWGWDCLPVLGYASLTEGARYELYNYNPGFLTKMDLSDARRIGIVDEQGNLIRRGQPTIEICTSVTALRGSNFVEANCLLDNGVVRKIYTSCTDNAGVPDRDWFVGKKPRDAKVYAGPSAKDVLFPWEPG